MNTALIMAGVCLIGILVLCAIGQALVGGKAKEAERGAAKPRNFPYEAVAGLLSDGEAAFFRTLQATVQPHTSIAFKTRLGDLIKVKQGLDRSQAMSTWNQISGKHVDFVIFDRENFRIIAAIELDDQSHQSKKAEARDEVKNKALEEAGIPLIRFACKRSYNAAAIADTLRAAILKR